MPWQRLLALVVMVSGGALSVSSLSTEWAISHDRGEATAEVVDVEHFRKQPDTITVRFTTESERSITADIEDDGPEIGDVVQVEYDRSEPNKARLKGSGGQAFAGLLYGVLALAGAVGLFFPRLGWFGRRSK